MPAYEKKPTELSSFKDLYCGARYFAFENNPNKPFFNTEPEDEIFVWDALVSEICAVGRFLEDRSISGCILWGQGQTFEASDIRDMIRWIKYFDKHYH